MEPYEPRFAVYKKADRKKKSGMVPRFVGTAVECQQYRLGKPHPNKYRIDPWSDERPTITVALPCTNLPGVTPGELHFIHFPLDMAFDDEASRDELLTVLRAENPAIAAFIIPCSVEVQSEVTPHPSVS